MTHDCDSIIKRPNCETQESHFKNTRITIKPKNTKKKKQSTSITDEYMSSLFWTR